MTNHRRTFHEQIAMARGSRFSVGGAHRCTRFWAVRFQCPFHGVEPEDDDSADDSDGDKESKVASPVSPTTGGSAVSVASGEKEPLQLGATPEVAPLADMVPIVVHTRGHDAPHSKAERGRVSIPKPPARVEAVGIPLHIPDESIPDFTPPGMEQEGDLAGVTAEKAFVKFLLAGAGAPLSAAENEMVPEAEPTAISEGSVSQGSGNVDFETLATVFIGAATASYLAHLRNVHRGQGVRRPLAPVKPRGTRLKRTVIGQPRGSGGGGPAGGRHTISAADRFQPGFGPSETQEENEERFNNSVEVGEIGQF